MNKVVVSLLAAGALALTIPAIAQQPKDAGTAAEAKKVVIPAKTFFKGQEKGQYFARTRLIGANVVDKEGTAIGNIEDLIIGPNNQVEGVIVGVGGILGVGEKKIGVRYSALKFETKDGQTVISLPQATKEVLAQLEAYKKAEAEPKGILQKAGETAKELTGKAKDAVKGAVDKSKEMMKTEEPKKKQP